MAGNARFHDKLHRKNHHTTPTIGYPDSGIDPIASPSEPFQGDFIINGVLSASSGIDILSANVRYDVHCENSYVRDTTYTNFISGQGTETIISDGGLVGNGDKTLTLDFRTGIYAKSPMFNILGSISSTGVTFLSSIIVGNSTDSISNDPNASLRFVSAHAKNYIESGKAVLTDSAAPLVFTSMFAGTEWARFDENGRLGIGTSTPSNTLHVSGGMTVTNNPSSYMYVYYDDNVKGPSMQMSGLCGAYIDLASSFNNTGPGGLSDYVLRLGTNNVNGGLLSNTFIESNQKDFSIITNTLPRMTITNSGKVGIGTTSPSQPLTVSGIISGDNNLYSGDIYINRGNTDREGGQINFARPYDNAPSWAIDTYTDNIGSLSSRVRFINLLGNAELVTLLSSGNFGIGTQNPTEKLHVEGNLLVTGNVTVLGDTTQIDTTITTTSAMVIDTSGVVDALRITQRGSGNVLLVEDEVNVDSSPFVITNVGYTGIGTSSPLTKLHVKSEYSNPIGSGLGISPLMLSNSAADYPWVRFGVSLYTGDYNPITQMGDQAIIFSGQSTKSESISANLVIAPYSSASNTGMRITYDGKIGIGIANPTEKLHVNGNITTDGSRIRVGKDGSGSFWLATSLNVNEGTNSGTVQSNNGLAYGFTTNGTWTTSQNWVVSGITAMTLTEGGSLCIGTGDGLHYPKDKLEVAGNVGSYGYRVKQGKPDGSPSSDTSSNGYSFGDDGDTGMFSPLNNGESGNATIGRIGWYCNNTETARTFVNSQPIFTIGGLSAASETYQRTTLAIGDSNNGGLIELRDGVGGHSVIYRDSFTDSLWLQGRGSNSSIKLSTNGTGTISFGVSATNNALSISNDGTVTIPTVSNTTITSEVLKCTKTMYVPVSTASVTTAVTLIIASPTYLFFNGGGSTCTVTLPVVTSINKGLTFIVKNIYNGAGNSDININNSSSVQICNIPKITYAQVIYDGTNWQYLGNKP